MSVAQWSERCAGVLCAGRRKISGGRIRGGSSAARRGSCCNDLAIARSPPLHEVIAAAFSFVASIRMLALVPLRGTGERADVHRRVLWGGRRHLRAFPRTKRHGRRAAGSGGDWGSLKTVLMCPIGVVKVLRLHQRKARREWSTHRPLYCASPGPRIAYLSRSG